MAKFFFDINMPELPPSRAPIVRRFKKKFPDIYKDAMEKYKEGEHDT